MQKAVNNLTETQVLLGGVEIGAKGQRVIRESLITDDEKKAVADSGAVIKFAHKEITVFVKAEKGADEEAEAKAKADAEAGTDTKPEAKIEHTHLDVAYPAELIKKDGSVNGSAGLKAKVKALQEQFGETILDDNAFMAKYPEADIETYRVEVGIDE